MLLQKNNNLIYLARLAGKTPADLSKCIIAGLEANGIEENRDYWECEINDCCACDLSVISVVEILKTAGLDNISFEALNAFLGLIFIGDGDCPVCGGEMEPTDGETEIVGGDGYITPFERETIWCEMTCSNCGHVESNEPY